MQGGIQGLKRSSHNLHAYPLQSLETELESHIEDAKAAVDESFRDNIDTASALEGLAKLIGFTNKYMTQREADSAASPPGTDSCASFKIIRHPMSHKKWALLPTSTWHPHDDTYGFPKLSESTFYQAFSQISQAKLLILCKMANCVNLYSHVCLHCMKRWIGIIKGLSP